MRNKINISSNKVSIFALYFSLLILAGCPSTPIPDDTLYQAEQERNEQLSKLEYWTIKGKIAFIEPDQKQSANLYWQHGKNNSKLTLTTFLGVNVLTLTSEAGVHTLKVDGRTYVDEDLELLLQSVTGVGLPVTQLMYWLKGLKAQDSDLITFSPTTNLPTDLVAHYDDKDWHIKYASYTLVEQFRLAKKITIKHRDLTIKMAIHSWTIDQ